MNHPARRTSRSAKRLLFIGVAACVTTGVTLAVAGAQDDEATASTTGFTLTCPVSVAEGATLACTLENVGSDVLDWPVVALVHRSDDNERALVTGSPVDVTFGTLDPTAETESGVWWVGDVLLGYSRFDWPRRDSDDIVVESPHAPVADPDVTGYVIDRSSIGAATVTVDVANAASDTEVHLRHRASGADWTVAAAVAPTAGTAAIEVTGLEASTEYSVEVALSSSFSSRVVAGSFTTPQTTREVRLQAVDDSDHESREKFYISLAPSGLIGIGDIYTNAQPVHITNDDSTSSDATLSSLTMRSHFNDIALDFSSSTTVYNLDVGYREAEITVTATATHSRATISVAGSSVESGQESQAVPLSVGANPVQVVVTPEDGQSDHANTYTLTVTRATRPRSVSVAVEGFTVVCPSAVSEGSSLVCSLTNDATTPPPPPEWPVVAIIHSTADTTRALITEDTVTPESSPLFGKDVRLAADQTPERQEYHYGHGTLFSGGSRSVQTVYGYESFDWEGSAAGCQSRRVVIDVLTDTRDESAEIFYVAVAPSGYTGISRLTDNKAPIVVRAVADTATAITDMEATDIGSETATVEVDVANAAADTSVHLRYRVCDSAQWTDATASTPTADTAEFTFTGLAPGSTYEVQASLDSAYTEATKRSITTRIPMISDLSATATGPDTAAVTVTVANAIADTRVQLRYRAGSSGDWTAATPVAPTSNTASFTLSVLSADTDYQVQAALDSGFVSPTSKSFTTDPTPPPAITGVVASRVSSNSATVTVSVANAVAATRVYLRYRAGSSGDWTAATPVAPTSNTASFTLSVLSADTDYQVQAALDNSFDSPTTKTFRTHPPPPAITDVVASDATADTVTVTVSVANAVAATRVHLQYRSGGGNWTAATPVAPTSNTAAFTLSVLSANTDYQVQAALDNAFSSPTADTFTTLTPAISDLSATATGPDTAAVTVTVANAAAATRVQLRYRAGSSGDWTAATPVAPASNTAAFTLSVLSADTDYQVQAALDNSFDSPTTKTFRTHPPPPAITDVVASDATADTVTVTLSVTNAVAATRVHLRYAVDDGDPNTEPDWTTVPNSRPVVDGAASFSLSVLTPDTGYVVQAAFDSSFTSPSSQTFATTEQSLPRQPGDGVGDGGPVEEERVEEEPADTEPADTEPFEEEPADTEPADTEPFEEEPADTEPADTEPFEEEPADTEPADTEPVEEEPADTEPVEEEPADTEPVEEEPADTEPVEEEPADTEPVEEEPADTEPADAEALAQAAAARFDDVAADAYYAAAVGWMLQHAITTGCNDDSFCSNQPTNRQQFIVFLWRLAGQPQPDTPGSEIFADVAQGSYADQAIGWAAQNGITSGCAPNNFCPSHTVTRAQAATFLYRHAGASHDPDPNTFSDVAADAYYAQAVAWMTANDITSGCAPNRFCPDQPATRAQVAALIYRTATNPQTQPDHTQP